MSKGKKISLAIVLALTLGCFIAFGVWISSIVSDISDTVPENPIAAYRDASTGRYVSDGGWVTLQLPDIYALSDVRERDAQIFAATTDKTVLTIRVIPEASTAAADAPIEDVMVALGEEMRAKQVDPSDPAQYGEMQLVTIGSYYFLIQEKQLPHTDGFNTIFVWQYTTFQNGTVYFIDFTTEWEDVHAAINDMDAIIASMQFNR
jgi:hypothetical protein